MPYMFSSLHCAPYKLTLNNYFPFQLIWYEFHSLSQTSDEQYCTFPLHLRFSLLVTIPYTHLTGWCCLCCALSPAQCTPSAPNPAPGRGYEGTVKWEWCPPHTTAEPRWSQLKSSWNTCVFLIDSQLCEVPHRHGEKWWGTELDPACTQDPQAFRRKPVSNVILQSSQEQTLISEPPWKQSWKFQSSVLILKYVSTEKWQVDQTLYGFC